LATEGLRISEAIDIRLSDIQDRGPFSLIKIRGKGKKQREIKISNEFLNRLNEHFQGKKYLLETRNGKQYRRESLTRLIAEKGQKTLGKKISAHTLRHSFAYIQRIEKKLPLETLSSYLGHASIEITASMYLPQRSFTIDELPDFGDDESIQNREREFAFSK
jgi:integrase/recombinase XerD